MKVFLKGFAERIGSRGFALLFLAGFFNGGLLAQLTVLTGDSENRVPMAMAVTPGQLILSGGGDICEGNCPEMPNFISFEVIGNDLPFTVNMVVTSTGFPSFPINGLPVTNGQVINICLEGIFPSFNPATNTLTVPTFAIGLTATVTVVSAMTNSGCPVTVNPNSLTIHFIEAPTVNIGPDQEICSGEEVAVTATMGGSASMATWTTSGDGTFADPSDLTTTYTPGQDDIDNGAVVLTISALDENMACIPATESMTVTIEPSIEVEVVTPISICATATAVLQAVVTGPSVDMEWTTDGDGNFDDPESPVTTYTPGPGDISSGTVILTFAPVDPGQCIGEIQSVELTIVPAPEVDVPLSLEACSDESIDIEISVQGDYSSVNWATSGDGTLIVYNDEEVNYTPGPQDIEDQFVLLTVTVVSAYPECGQTTYVIPIDVISCACPPLELAPPALPLCSASDTLLVSSLIVQADPGTWSVTGTPGGSFPGQIVGPFFITNNSDSGVYTLTYTLSFPEPGCPGAMDVDVNVESSDAYRPNLGADQSQCGLGAVMLMSSFPGMPPSGYFWTTLGDGILTPSPGNPAVSATYVPGSQDSLAGQVQIVYTAIPPICDPVSDTIVIVYLQAPFAVLAADTLETCNMTSKGSRVDLSDLVIAGDTTGQWLDLGGSGVNLSRLDSVDFNGVLPGFYAFSYTTATAMPPCANQTYVLTIEVKECLCPVLTLQNPPAGVCQNLPALSLNPFLMAGGPGSWSIIQVPPGMNPATLMDSSMIITGRDPGDYRLRFTLSTAPLPGCPDSVEMNVFVQAVPTVSIGGPGAACGLAPVALNVVLGGSAIGVTWQTGGTGSFQNPIGLATGYVPAASDLSASPIKLWVLATDTFGFCPPGSDTLQLQLFTPPSASFSSFGDTLCTDPDSNHLIDLTALIVSGDATGIWSAPSGQPDLSNPSNTDFSGLPSGTYTIQYATQSAIPPCTDTVYSFAFVLESCSCPPLRLDLSPIVLCGDTMLALSTLLLEGGPGSWDLTSGPPGGQWPSVVGDQLEVKGSSSGQYELTYTLRDTLPGCPVSASLFFRIDGFPDWTVVSKDCSTDNLYYLVEIQTNGISIFPDTGRLQGGANGLFVIDSIPISTDLTGLVRSALGNCAYSFLVEAPTCNCSLMLEDIADTITFCPGDTFVLIPIVTGAQGLPFATWVTPYGNFMRPTLPLYREGNYIWIVRDMAGCEARDSFYANFLGPDFIGFSVSQPSCPGLADGSIYILDLPGGDPPFSISLDGGVPQSSLTLPYRFDAVSTGLHRIEVTDMNGCMIDTLLVVNAPVTGSLTLGPDQVISSGDSVRIQPVWSGMVPAVWVWSPAIGAIDGAPFWITPQENLSLQVIVTDTAGCQYRDSIRITVYDQERVYIPNVFSPNDDQVNDRLVISASSTDIPILSMEIFDRWGGLLFGQYDGTVFAWDGRSKGDRVAPGVYVCKVVYQDAQGQRVTLWGDVTLLR